MSVSSTRPIGPPPKRRRVRFLRSPPFWTGVATALGLFATLWSVVIGKSVNDLLSEGPVPYFRARVTTMCDRPNLEFGQLPFAPFTAGDRTKVLARMAADIGVVNDGVFNALLAIEAVQPPTQFRSEYEAFQKGWAGFYGDLHKAQQAVQRAYDGSYRYDTEGGPQSAFLKGLSSLLNLGARSASRAHRPLNAVSSNALLMGLIGCSDTASGLDMWMQNLARSLSDASRHHVQVWRTRRTRAPP